MDHDGSMVILRGCVALLVQLGVMLSDKPAEYKDVPFARILGRIRHEAASTQVPRMAEWICSLV